MVERKKFKIENEKLIIISKVGINDKHNKIILNMPYKTKKEFGINENSVFKFVITKETPKKDQKKFTTQI